MVALDPEDHGLGNGALLTLHRPVEEMESEENEGNLRGLEEEGSSPSLSRVKEEKQAASRPRRKENTSRQGRKLVKVRSSHPQARSFPTKRMVRC